MLSTAVGGLYLISKGREAAGGMVFALSAMIKYTPIIFIPYLFFRKKIKAALSATFGIIFYLFLPALFIGVKANFYYLRKLLPFLTQSTILEPGTILDPKNQSLFSAIKRQFSYCISDYHAPHMLFENSALSDIHIKMIFIFFAALIYAFILIRPRLNRDSILYYNLDYAMLLVCACLFNMNAWMLSYLLLIMPYFIIVYYAVKASFKDTAVTALLLLSYLLNIITIKGLAGEAFAYKALFYSPFTLMALVLFLALLKIKFFGKIDKHGYI